ncbi:hypothetical protein KAFR_0C00560 [Kazachstania africana CBS 2517]|uniref:Uncharacterized protein n=1 Tax=Kazachstania africana (strain ATCC 22294 / BCRC 22015 / CBS 2517 / CECT 1963 / NBRC 1671 / NRRL Y-8276) TaxID=1071382 RepID=H2ARQ1_KAZAF|nr:hypothetical protein KAFR_0C00560 [Kazachstania africana CBS 2517]CCF57051.1 hypothetical protein KAFR_0C00560 [Kazachstania africana CBS 2517]
MPFILLLQVLLLQALFMYSFCYYTHCINKIYIFFFWVSSFFNIRDEVTKSLFTTNCTYKSQTSQMNTNGHSVEEAVYKYVGELNYNDTQHDETSDSNWDNLSLGSDDLQDDLSNTNLQNNITTPAKFDLEDDNNSVVKSLADKNYRDLLPKIISKSNDSKIILVSDKISAQLVVEFNEKRSKLIPNPPKNSNFLKTEQDLINEFVLTFLKLNNITMKQFNSLIWSENDKNEIEKLVKMKFWKSIYKIFNYRLNSSIYKHVRRKYNNFNNHWNDELDERLFQLCHDEKLEGQWSKIGKLLDKLPDDCRDRWRNYVKVKDTKNSSKKWSPNEEAKLLRIVNESLHKDQSANWGHVSQLMGGARSRIQCRYKWNKLHQQDSLVRINSLSSEKLIMFFNKIKSLNTDEYEKIDWDSLANKDLTPMDWKLCYNKWKRKIKSNKEKTVVEICDELLKLLKHEQPVK